MKVMTVRYIIAVLTFIVTPLLASVAFASDQPDLNQPIHKMADMTVNAVAPDINASVTIKDGLITKMVVDEVRRGSVAERQGFMPGLEIIKYRGESVIGISTKDFEALRKKSLVLEEISVLYEVTGLENAPVLGIPVPEEVRDNGSPAFMVDRLIVNVDDSMRQEDEFELKRPLKLSGFSNGYRVGEVCTELQEWQLSSKGEVDITSAEPVVRGGKMVAWRVKSKKNDFETAQAVSMKFFKAPPGLAEGDFRSAFEQNPPEGIKPEEIIVFFLLKGEDNKLIGAFVGTKAGRMSDLTEFYREQEIVSKERMVTKTPQPNLYRTNNLPYKVKAQQ